jgi:sugar lactone lactonase YvrE
MINSLTSIVSAWFTPSDPTTNPTNLYSCGSNGCILTWDGQGIPYLSGQLDHFGGAGYLGVARMNPDGGLTSVVGKVSGSAVEGVPAGNAALQSPPFMAFDAARNLYLLDTSAQVIRRVESATSRITTVSGTGSAGYGGDYVTWTGAALSAPWGLLIDAQRNLYFSDTNNNALRMVAGAGQATPFTATLELVSGDGQSVIVDQVPTQPFGAKLVDQNQSPLVGFTVTWSVVDPGGGLYASSANTNVSGLVSSLGRPGLIPDAGYRFTASFNDFYGQPVSGSPITFTLDTYAPDAGTVFTVVDGDHSPGNDGLPGAATLAHIGQPKGLARASDGSVYIADASNHRVLRLTPDGNLTNVAGNGQVGSTGDGALAVNATLNSPVAVAVDEVRGLLYIADTNSAVIRAVSLSSGVISTFAGGGSAPSPGYGDSGPATSAALSNPNWMAIGPDGMLYVSDLGHNRIRRINLTSGIISAWFTPSDPTTNPTNLYTCSGGCQVSWDNSGTPYLTGSLDHNGGAGFGGVAQMYPDGGLNAVAGKVGGDVTTDGILATNAAFTTAALSVAFDANNTLYIVDPNASRIRTVDGTGAIHTVAGSGTAGYAGDLVPLSQAQLSGPWMVLPTPEGHLLISDTNNDCVRMSW